MKTTSAGDIRIPYYYYCIVILTSYLVYFNAFNAEFVYDDRQAVVTNPDVIGERWTGLFINDFWGNPMAIEGSHKSFRPLTVLTFRIQNMIHGLRPELFHHFNILLHAINSCLGLRIGMDVLPSKEWSLLANLLFSVHAVNSEAVCSIVGRADLLATFFLLLSMNTNKTSQLLLLSILGILSKETAIAIVPLSIGRKILDWKKKTVRDVLQLLTAGGIMVYLRLVLNNFQSPRFSSSDNPIAHEKSVFTRFMTFSYLPIFHLKLLVFPNQLSFDWSMDSIPMIRSPLDSRFIICTLTYLGITWYLAKLLKDVERNKKRLTLLSWILLPLVFTTNIITYVGFVAAERIVYMSSLPFCLLLGHMLSKRQSWVKHIFLVLLLLHAGRTWSRSVDWKNEENLFKSAIEINPAKACANLGYVYAGKKEVGEALKSYKTALKHRPSMSDVWYNLAILTAQAGNSSLAIVYYSTAIRYRPFFAAAHLNLGILLWDAGEKSEAVKTLKNCVQLDGINVKSYRTHQQVRTMCASQLGRYLMKDEKYLEAIEVFEMSLEFSSDSKKIYNLIGECYLHLNNFSLAELNFRKALEPDGSVVHLKSIRTQNSTSIVGASPAVLYNLAVTAMKMENWTQSETYFEMALQLDEVHLESLRGLAETSRLTGNIEKSRRIYEKIVELTPMDATAHANLGAILHLSGVSEAALKSYDRSLALNPEDDVSSKNREKLLRKMRRRAKIELN